MKKSKIVILLLVITITLTGCFKRDTLDGIDIKVTSYPVEYLVSSIYGYNSNIDSIYPNGTNKNTYTLTNKQIKEYAASDMFIYDGLTNEKQIAATFLNKNKSLKVIDVSKGISLQNKEEELWLCPSNYLMLAENIKEGLLGYANSSLLIQEIEDNYSNLKLTISQYDAKINTTAENAENKTIIVGDNVFKFLEKYGFTVLSVEDSENFSSKEYQEAKDRFQNKQNKYIYVLDSDDTESDNIKKMVDAGAEIIKINSMTTLTDDERKNNEDYTTIMDTFIEEIKKEAYNS